MSEHTFHLPDELWSLCFSLLDLSNLIRVSLSSRALRKQWIRQLLTQGSEINLGAAPLDAVVYILQHIQTFLKEKPYTRPLVSFSLLPPLEDWYRSSRVSSVEARYPTLPDNAVCLLVEVISALEGAKTLRRLALPRTTNTGLDLLVALVATLPHLRELRWCHFNGNRLDKLPVPPSLKLLELRNLVFTNNSDSFGSRFPFPHLESLMISLAETQVMKALEPDFFSTMDSLTELDLRHLTMQGFVNMHNLKLKKATFISTATSSFVFSKALQSINTQTGLVSLTLGASKMIQYPMSSALRLPKLEYLDTRGFDYSHRWTETFAACPHLRTIVTLKEADPIKDCPPYVKVEESPKYRDVVYSYSGSGEIV